MHEKRDEDRVEYEARLVVINEIKEEKIRAQEEEAELKEVA